MREVLRQEHVALLRALLAREREQATLETCKMNHEIGDKYIEALKEVTRLTALVEQHAAAVEQAYKNGCHDMSPGEWLEAVNAQRMDAEVHRAWLASRSYRELKEKK